MQSSSTSAVSDSLVGPVTLPLFKLSHCTISGPGARMLWTHLPNRDDMFAVFDEIRSRELDGVVTKKQVLKLIRSGELFETIDFDSLKHQTRLDQQRAQSQPVPDELLYVVIVVKRPLLALRYRLPDGRIRRLQMNFQPPIGCDTALDILKVLGLPLRLRQENEPPRPIIQRPYSSQSIMTTNTSPSRSEDSRNTLGNLYEDAPPSAQPHISDSRPEPSQDGEAQDIFSKPVSYIQDPRIPPQQGSSVNGASTHYTAVTRPISSVMDFDTLNHTSMQPPAIPRLLPSPMIGNQLPYTNGYNARPISAPELNPTDCWMDTAPLSQMLPPVRKLPFPTTSRGRDIAIAPESSGQLPDCHTDDHIPKPKEKRAPGKPKTTRSSSGLKSSAAKARSKKTTSARNGADTVPSSSAPQGNAAAMKVSLNQAPPSSAPPQINSTLEALEQTVSIMSKNFTPPPSRSNAEAPGKRSLSQMDDSETNQRSTKIARTEPTPLAQPQSVHQFNPILSNIEPAEFLDSLDGWIRKYHNLPVPEAPSMINKDSLARYASKSDEERAKIIDNMICECLQDENFGKLADDLEGHWKRICLGF